MTGRVESYRSLVTEIKKEIKEGNFYEAAQKIQRLEYSGKLTRDQRENVYYLYRKLEFEKSLYHLKGRLKLLKGQDFSESESRELKKMVGDLSLFAKKLHNPKGKGERVVKYYLKLRNLEIESLEKRFAKGEDIEKISNEIKEIKGLTSAQSARLCLLGKKIASKINERVTQKAEEARKKAFLRHLEIMSSSVSGGFTSLIDPAQLETLRRLAKLPEEKESVEKIRRAVKEIIEGQRAFSKAVSNTKEYRIQERERDEKKFFDEKFTDLKLKYVASRDKKTIAALKKEAKRLKPVTQSQRAQIKEFLNKLTRPVAWVEGEEDIAWAEEQESFEKAIKELS